MGGNKYLITPPSIDTLLVLLSVDKFVEQCKKNKTFKGYIRLT